ncbi:NAD(P)H oxidoreductase [Paenibacillus sp. GSMTC-2017]|uniref:NAD(P)H oxidoreductase n=1 Tax=Paenibacillus sp. GSMTC-2017 TaxID=2794350 RepID=UPI0018D83F25|nr:NAD(P)H oxidoreductase [Paenibacillus sp. GSMTC-2017]MBH5319611.1 NAD(P)H oxidoreductase [Paenibacillus sp. GSMTC-2017]
MKVLTIVSHPRTQSLTFEAVRRFTQGLEEAGHETDVLDLHRIGFDPVLWEADEPDYSGPPKQYSPEVQAEMERLLKYDALAFVFPVYWYSIPAMLKGYIDRVWNYGFAYGSNHLPHKKTLWLGLAGASLEHFQKRDYDKMIALQLNIGMSDYVGIKDSSVELLYDTGGDQAHIEQLLQRAYQLGLDYATTEQATPTL